MAHKQNEINAKLRTRDLKFYCSKCGWWGAGDDRVTDNLGNSGCCPKCSIEATMVDEFIYRVKVNLTESMQIPGVGYTSTVYMFVQTSIVIVAKTIACEHLKKIGLKATSTETDLAMIQTPGFYRDLLTA